MFPKARFIYENWRGESSARLVEIRDLHFGVTEYHRDMSRWYIEAFDFNKLDKRCFLLEKMTNLRIVLIESADTTKNNLAQEVCFKYAQLTGDCPDLKVIPV